MGFVPERTLCVMTISTVLLVCTVYARSASLTGLTLPELAQVLNQFIIATQMICIITAITV